MGDTGKAGGGPARGRRIPPLLGMPLAGTVGCALLFGLRAAVTGRMAYAHLAWNLFLALVPYLVAAAGATRLGRLASPRRRGLAAALVALIWLLFFPNASYIFTDFIHVFNRSFLRAPPSDWLGLNAIIWYDILMNAAFAFVGHLLGLASLWLMSRTAGAVWGRRASRVLVGAAILLSGLGIYLGRFSRLNSWDVVAAPGRVFSELATASTDPKALMFSAAFSAFILLSYAALAAFKALPEPGIGDGNGAA